MRSGSIDTDNHYEIRQFCEYLNLYKICHQVCVMMDRIHLPVLLLVNANAILLTTSAIKSVIERTGITCLSLSRYNK